MLSYVITINLLKIIVLYISFLQIGMFITTNFKFVINNSNILCQPRLLHTKDNALKYVKQGKTEIRYYLN